MIVGKVRISIVCAFRLWNTLYIKPKFRSNLLKIALRERFIRRYIAARY
jgi:hypothetical protein